MTRTVRGSRAPGSTPGALLVVLAVVAALVGALAGCGVVRPGVSRSPTLAVGEDAWVVVSVATVWRAPSSPREVDAPALTAPVRVRQWLAGMTVEERRGLGGRADTQVLLGDRVRVLELRKGWARVRVPDQPVPGSDGGYRGWVPRRQLTAVPPAPADQVATVTAPTRWLRDPDTGSRVLLVGFGTRLPYLGTDDDGRVHVATSVGGELVVGSRGVSVHDPADPALPATRRSLVRSAKQFVGLDYLWAGRSGFGFDCSGLTSLVHRVHGVVIPRDAAPQAASGEVVAAGDVVRGDLLFYATDGVVHHVAMYAGKGLMVHSPGTGQTVEVISTSTPAYAQEYAGARRYLD